MRPAVNQRL